jgi:hypothetical protein
LLNQTIKGGAASGGFAAAEDTGTMNVESCDVGPGSAAAILIFDAHRALRRRGQSGMLAASGLDAGLLVGRDDKFIVFEGFTVPGALIQIQDPAGLDGEGRVAGEDPAAVVPGADGVLMEPPPNRAARDSGNQTGIANPTGDVGSIPVGERNAVRSRQLAGERLNLSDQFWGKNPGTARAGALVQSGDSFFEEALSPHADYFATGIEAGGYPVIGQALGSEKHHLGAHDIKIRQRIFRGPPEQLALFLLGQVY